MRQRVSQRRLAAGVDEEVGGGKRDERRDQLSVRCRIPGDRLNRPQLLGWDCDGFGVGVGLGPNVVSGFSRTVAE